MRWNAFVVSATLLLAATMPGSAQVSVDMNKITCRDWLGYSPEVQNTVRLWMSGYYNAAANNSVLDYDRLQRNTAKIVAYCKSHGSSNLPTAIQNTGLQ